MDVVKTTLCAYWVRGSPETRMYLKKLDISIHILIKCVRIYRLKKTFFYFVFVYDKHTGHLCIEKSFVTKCGVKITYMLDVVIVL